MSDDRPFPTAVEAVFPEALAFDRVPARSAVSAAVTAYPVEERLTYVFTHGRFLLHLPSAAARHAPCPRCLARYLAAADDFAPSDGFTSPSDATTAGPAHRRGLTALAREADDTTATLLDTETDDHEQATVLAHPACDHDGYPPAPAPSIPASPETVVADPFGPIRSVGPISQSTGADGATGLSLAHAVVSTPLAGRSDGSTPAFTTTGSGSSAETARLTAVMEGIERCGLLVPETPTTTGRANELSVLSVPSSAWYGHDYESEHVRHPPADPDEPRRWAYATPLDGGPPVAVPFSLVTVTPTDESFVHTTTSGGGAHGTRPEAVQSGLLELLERDALVRAWYEQRTCPRLRPSGLPSRLRDLFGTLTTAGWEATVLDVTVHPPCSTVVVVLDGPNGRLVTGAGSGVTCPTAVSAAVEEALETRAMMRLTGVEPLSDPTAVRGTDDHLRLYQTGPQRERLEQWLTAGPLVDPDDRTEPEDADAGSVGEDADTDPASVADPVPGLPDDAVGRILRKVLATHELSVSAVDVTPSTVVDRGVRVVRTLSPHLVPITFGYRRERFVRPATGDRIDPVTRLPHPFP